MAKSVILAGGHGGGTMTYYWGLLIGATIGYVFSLITMLIIWSLCVIAMESEEREYAEKINDKEQKR
jgi:hypothetical protein